MLGKALYFITNVRGVGGLLLLRLGVARQAALSFDAQRFSRMWISNPGKMYSGTINLSVDRDTVDFVQSGMRIRLAYDSMFQLRENIRSIVGIFYNELYRFPEMRGSVIFDVGASVGDSTIYLSRYSRRIYALEPYPYSYALLKRNIALNGLSGRVKAINCGVSDRPGSVVLTGGRVSGITAFLRASASGARIRLITLRQMAALHKGGGKLSLKLNCLGYEHRIIMGARPAVLRLFSSILVYTELPDHHGMVAHLEAAGFRVRVSSERGRDQVLIFATRRPGR